MHVQFSSVCLVDVWCDYKSPEKTLGDGNPCLGESGGILGVDVEIGLGRAKFRNKFLGLPPEEMCFFQKPIPLMEPDCC